MIQKLTTVRLVDFDRPEWIAEVRLDVSSAVIHICWTSDDANSWALSQMISFMEIRQARDNVVLRLVSQMADELVTQFPRIAAPPTAALLSAIVTSVKERATA